MSSHLKVWLLRFLCCALLLAGGMSVFAQNSPEEDDFLQLLRSELQLQYDSLQQTNFRPYFMAYRVNETMEHSISANFGKIYDNSTSKSVVLTIEMRVGTPETDNYHYLTYKTPYIKQIPLPLDENPALVRKILRNETRKAYQKAVDQSVENSVEEIFLVGDQDYEKFLYTRRDMDGYYEPPINTESHWNEALWEHSLWYCTLHGELELTEKSANIRFQSTRKYLVNSENSYFVQNEENTLLTLRIGRLTPEHTPEHLERQYYAFFPDQLPDEEVLQSELGEMEILLSHVIHAEKCDLSHCPVLLSPKASSVLIHNLLGHDLENQENSLLRKKIGQQVMPESFSLYSDPSFTPSHGVFPSGSYTFDDEGVKSRKVQHVLQGEFKQLLSSRTQQPNGYQANGSARGICQLPSARQSNLFLRSDKPLNDNQLLESLSQEAKKQSLEYALYVKEVEVRCDTDDVITLYPTVCYKIYPNHSKPDEMVRDVLLTGSKQQWLSNLLAAGEDAEYVAITCHSQQDDLMTCGSAPALLFRSIEVQSQSKTPQPRLVKVFDGEGSITPMSTAELLQKSAQYEWDVDVSELKVAEETAPYYEEFLMTDARVLTVEASEGSVFYANEKPVRQFVPRILLGSDAFNNENLTNESLAPACYPLPFENHRTFANDFRNASDAEYQKSLKQWKAKQALLPTPESRTLPDRSYAPATQTDDEHTFDLPTMNNLQHLACDASAALAKHDGLSRSGVNIYIMLGNAYFWNSEKTTYSRPVSVIALQIYGAVDFDGQEYIDGKTLFLPSTDSLFSSQIIQQEIEKFASHLKKVKEQRIRFKGIDFAPMLVEGEAVGQLLSSACFPSLLANRDTILYNHGLPTYPLGYLLDHIVTSKKINIIANKSGDVFDHATFSRHYKTDAEGVETQETEIIRNGELISLLGNRTFTKSTPYSNGFQQLGIHNAGCFGTKGASRIDFEHKVSVSPAKLKKMLLQEAKKQGLSHAYILRYIEDNSLQNIESQIEPRIKLLQLYKVDVRTGKEVPVTDAVFISFQFFLLDNVLAVSNQKAAYPVMMNVKGATGTRDFPFSGVPTCIVAPNAILLELQMIGD